MAIVDEIRPVSFLKSHAAELLKQVNDTQRPVVITQNGTPKAVLQDPHSYEEMRRAIGLLKLIAQGEEAVRSGRVISQEAVFQELEKRFT